MSELWIWSVQTTSAPDVTGWDVVAMDGEIGKIDEVSYDAGRGWIVVDTGWWIFGHKRMIPAGRVISIDPDDRKVFVGMSKDEIKHAPDYDDEMAKLEGSSMDRLEKYYGTKRQRVDVQSSSLAVPAPRAGTPGTHSHSSSWRSLAHSHEKCAGVSGCGGFAFTLRSGL